MRGQVVLGANVAAEFADIARDLRQAGETGLRRQLYSALQREARPAIDAARSSAASTLPRRGGLAARVAGSNFRVVARAGRNPSIRITVTEGGASVDLRAIDAGLLRHPVFGNRDRWVGQHVREGWFTRPLTDHAEGFRAALSDAVDAIVGDLSR